MSWTEMLAWFFLKFYFRERAILAAPGKNNAFVNNTKYITEEAAVETSLEKAKNMTEGTLSGEKGRNSLLCSLCSWSLCSDCSQGWGMTKGCTFLPICLLKCMNSHCMSHHTPNRWQQLPVTPHLIQPWTDNPELPWNLEGIFCSLSQKKYKAL